ncbi:hypothetical protein [Fortiea contorta]|uniref:hypothetical protein n=1 Tax=Fortiea contorta TaxID=1892405 RepID=UPI00034C02C6|nr:hypothetical protein [Fortiea contorta]
MKPVILATLLPVIFITTIFGCSHSDKIANNTTTPVATDYSQKNTLDSFSLNQKADEAILVDGKNQTLATITSEKSGKFKILDSAGKNIGYVVAKKDSWKLKNSEQNQELYTLKKQDDGDYKLKDAVNQEIYRIKVRDDNFEIETPDKKSFYQVITKAGKTSLMNTANKTSFSPKSDLSPIAVACFGFDVLTREQQAGLAFAVNSTGGK